MAANTWISKPAVEVAFVEKLSGDGLEYAVARIPLAKAGARTKVNA